MERKYTEAARVGVQRQHLDAWTIFLLAQ
jgi:hypothetical protein